MTDVYTIFVENRSADCFQLSREADIKNNRMHTCEDIRSQFHVYTNRQLNSHLLQVTVKMLPGRRRNWCFWKLWKRDACRLRIFWIDFVQPSIIRMQNYEKRPWFCWQLRWMSEWCLLEINYIYEKKLFFFNGIWIFPDMEQMRWHYRG